ncbi:MAG: peptide MFS transporter [Bacteroidales bacterium]
MPRRVPSRAQSRESQPAHAPDRGSVYATNRPATAPNSHPPGLYVLFFTELWERYSFYSMMAILTLYMDERLGFAQATSARVYGAYIAAVFFLPLVGGLLADRWLGFYRAVIVGAVLMGIGQFVLGAPSLAAFFGGLTLLACGTGMLKPNISTIVGNLYADRPHLRDAGFNIFYMGINVGAFIAPISVAWLRAHYGWTVAFRSASVAMLVALVIFVGFRDLIVGAAQRAPRDAALETPQAAADARSRTLALLVIFAIVVAFWIAFYQNGFALTLWARDNTATRLSPEIFQSVDPLGIILFSPLAVLLWAALRRRRAEPTTIGKILIGMVLTALSFVVMIAAGLVGGDTGRVSAAWLITSYLVIAAAEICLSPMGLSLVTRVAPPRLRGTLMGAWFVATAIGGYLAGYLGVYWSRIPHSRFFLLVAAIAIVAAATLVVARRRLQANLR